MSAIFKIDQPGWFPGPPPAGLWDRARRDIQLVGTGGAVTFTAQNVAMVSYLWELISEPPGPATPIIGAGLPACQASFLKTGGYLMRLTVDAGIPATEDVSVRYVGIPLPNSGLAIPAFNELDFDNSIDPTGAPGTSEKLTEFFKWADSIIVPPLADVLSAGNSAGATSIDMNNNKITGLFLPSDPGDATNKDYVDTALQSIDWQESVLGEEAAPPGVPGAGDKYLVVAPAVGVWTWHEDDIAEWDAVGMVWDFTPPDDGMVVWIEDDEVFKVYNGAAWVSFGSTIAHATLDSLNTATYWHLTQVEYDAITGHLVAFSNPHSVTLDQAYTAGSTVAVDIGDVTWNGVGAFSFVVDTSGCTGIVDGFIVQEGTDHFKLLHQGANTLDVSARLAEVSIRASGMLELYGTGPALGTGVDIDVLAGGGAILIGCANQTNQISIGGAGARDIYLGSTSALTVVIQALDLNYGIIANDAAAHALTINLSNAGAGTAAIDIDTDDAITVDSTYAGISLDAATDSNFSITDNSVSSRTLTVSATNAGAGNAYVDIYSEDETKLRATGGPVLIDATGVVEINSSAGVIGIGNDAVVQNINVGTGAAARTITIGNAASTEVEIDALLVDINAGATGLAVDSVGAITINSSTSTIGIGNDAVAQNVNIGIAGARTIAIGSAAATGVNLDALAFSIDATNNSNITVDGGDLSISTTTTGNMSIAAIARMTISGVDYVDIDATGGFVNIDATGAISLGAASSSDFTVTSADLTLQTVTSGNIGITSSQGISLAAAAGTILVDATGVIEINSSAGVIGIGNDAVAQDINLGTAGARTISVGSAAATVIYVESEVGGSWIADILGVNPAAELEFAAGGVDRSRISLSSTGNGDWICTANAAAAIGLTLHAENTNVGGTAYVYISADDDVTIDSTAAGISIDAIADSNFSLSGGSAASKTLTIHSENTDSVGAGFLIFSCGDRYCTTTQRVYITAESAAGMGGSIYVTASDELVFAGYGGPGLAYNDVAELALDASFAANSIIGALNELKNGPTWTAVYDVNANTYTVTTGEEAAVLHVTYTATGLCTITINTAWIAVDGNTVTIKDTGLNASVNNIVIETQAAELIEGAVNALINADGDSLTLQAFGGNLYVI